MKTAVAGKTFRRSFFDFFRKPDIESGGKPKLYLHVGLPKTGTTAIQRFLFNNRELLKTKHGIYYPDRGLHWCQHVPFVKSIISPRFKDAQFNKAIEPINSEEWLASAVSSCVSANCDTVILSSEFFWAAPAMQAPLAYHEDTPENLAHLDQAVEYFKESFCQFEEIKVIFYLRRQDCWLESFFNQQIKNGFGMPCDEELLPARIYLLYAKNLELWAKHFGRENLVIRMFEKASPNVVEDFCSIVGITPDSTFTPAGDDAASVNVRLSPCALRVMRKAIEKKADKDMLELMRVVLTSSSARISPERWRGEKGVFSKELHSQLLSVYKKDNQKLAELYPYTSSYLDEEAAENHQVGDSQPECWEQQVEMLLELLISQYQRPVSNSGEGEQS